MSFATTNRSPAAVAATVAVHAAVVAVALVGIRIAVPPAPPPPIITINHRDTPKPPPPPLTPRTHEQRIAVSVDRPVIEIAEPPRADFTQTATKLDPGPGPAGGGTEVTELPKPPPPAGETRSASIDARFRADFQPLYPPASQRMGEAGTVLVRVVVGIDGRVVRAVVARSSGFPRLDEAAIARALTRWRFVPALRDGVPVEAEREVPVTFRLMQG